MVGVKAWNAGHAADDLVPVFKKTFAHHLNHGGWVYSSLDMKKGINIDEMKEFATELEDLIKLDPRGGHFLQKDVHEAIKRLSVEDSSKGLFDSYTQVKGHEDNEHTISLIAYTYRVVLSHVREKYDAFTKIDQNAATTHPEWLRSLYSHMKDVVNEPPRMSPQYPRKKHPLPAFRLPDEDEDDDNKPVTVLKQIEMTATEAMAVKLLSDGCKVIASSYSAGDGGFAIASWGGSESW
eukprot:4891188-Pyramimonas_sp.AAC.1